MFFKQQLISTYPVFIFLNVNDIKHHAGVIYRVLGSEKFRDKVIEGEIGKVSTWISTHATVAVPGIKVVGVSNTMTVKPQSNIPPEGEDVVIYDGLPEKFIFKGNAPLEMRNVFCKTMLFIHLATTF